MAKINFTKLGLKPDTKTTTIEFAGQQIEVLQYLPVQRKLALIGRVIHKSHEEDYSYANPVKIKVFTLMEIIFEYTNLVFTEKQREDFPKLFDTLMSSGLIDEVIQNIPRAEYKTIVDGVNESVHSIYEYQNSAYGIVEGIKTSYMDTEISIEELKKQIQSLQDTSLLKDIIPLLGLK